MSEGKIVPGTKKQIEEVKAFLKEAWCITGDVKYVDIVTVEVNGLKIRQGIFRMEDEKRGVFYTSVGASEEIAGSSKN